MLVWAKFAFLHKKNYKKYTSNFSFKKWGIFIFLLVITVARFSSIASHSPFVAFSRTLWKTYVEQKHQAWRTYAALNSSFTEQSVRSSVM